MSDIVDTPLEGGENLPSSVADATLDTSKWDATSLGEGTFKDGKMFGQYDNLADLHAGYKALQDKHTATVRDIKEGAKSTEAELATIQATREAQTQANTVMGDLVSKVVQGSEITEEMTAQLAEHNLDVRDLKLNAIEYKETIQQAHSIVGGSENYDAMIAWAKTTLTQAEVVDFDKGINGPSAHLYIKGLYSDFNASGTTPPTDTAQPEARVSGETVTTSNTRGYATQAEMLRDVAYINSNAGKDDKGARAVHQQRLSKTSNDVIYG